MKNTFKAHLSIVENNVSNNVMKFIERRKGNRLPKMLFNEFKFEFDDIDSNTIHDVGEYLARKKIKHDIIVH